MKTRTRIWIGIGMFVLVGTSGAQGVDTPFDPGGLRGGAIAVEPHGKARVWSPSHVVAQHGHRGEAGGSGERGEAGAKGQSALPSDLDFALGLSQLRGHLLIGNDLVKAGQWTAALPHFLHPIEEIYDDLRPRLRDYQVPPFEMALKALADTVKAKKAGEVYAKAWKAVENALAAADRGLQIRQRAWPAFTVQAALKLLKSAAEEYEEALVGDRIAKPVEYQDARGFVWQAERMLDGVAADLETKDAEALRRMRAALAEVKNAFPTPVPPRKPVKDYGEFLSDVARAELAASKLM